ncbi:DUF5130 domain-containing protein [Nocardioides sp. TF02-7]|nr:DUF5130 family protein [Nocardioides sp. TF02-7]UMG91702.1 DUF5130 domain-containing protein [Nocardioides sp. TF02-7]
MPSGAFLTDAERAALDATIRAAEQACRAEISVYIGPTGADEPRVFATSLHNTLVAPPRSILVLVDPGRRAVEVVTGGYVRRKLTDAEAALAVEEMTRSFADGDLAGGLTRGIRLLADHAR